MTVARKTDRQTPRPLRTGSHTDALAALEPGKHLVRSRDLPYDRSLNADALSEAKRALVSAATPTIARALARFPERRYEIETGVLLTSANNLYSTIIIRRTR